MKAKIKAIVKFVPRALIFIIGLPPVFVITFILGGIDAVFGSALCDPFFRILEKIKKWVMHD
jgi:hypothetical protein